MNFLTRSILFFAFPCALHDIRQLHAELVQSPWLADWCVMRRPAGQVSENDRMR